MSSLTERIQAERARSRQIRLLIVEEDLEIAQFIQRHLIAHYTVEPVKNADQALASFQNKPPDLLLLASKLPGITLVDLLSALRQASHGRLPPTIILGRPDDSRKLKLAALELGVADYLIKPFDMEELRYRVRNALPSPRRQADLITGLPGWLAADEAFLALREQTSWTALLIQIQHFDPYRLVYGYIAGNDVLRTTAGALADASTTHGRFDDFIGHAGDNTFLLFTTSREAERLPTFLKQAFHKQRSQFYSPPDLARGYTAAPNNQNVPLMRLAIGVVQNSEARFDDILDLIALAETRCQADRPG